MPEPSIVAFDPEADGEAIVAFLTQMGRRG